MDESDQLAAARIGWCREISQPPTVNDPAKIPALVGLAAQAQAAGANDLAGNLLWRAAQRCWWSNASSELRTAVLAAANKLVLPETDARLIAISAYAEPLQLGADIFKKLQRLSRTSGVDPSIARILGSTANVIGAFDLGVSFLTGSAAALRDQGRLSDLARVLFTQASAEMEVGDWMGAMREAEESARLAEETGGPLWIARGHDCESKALGDVRQSGAIRSICGSGRTAFFCPLRQFLVGNTADRTRSIRDWGGAALGSLRAPTTPFCACRSGFQFRYSILCACGFCGSGHLFRQRRDGTWRH